MSVLKVRDENGNWIEIPSIKGDKGEAGDLSPHAHRHKTGGEDAITPADIGAAEANHTHTAEDVGAASIMHRNTHAIGVADPLIPSDIGAAEENHASRHAIGGVDRIKPADIGASPEHYIVSSSNESATDSGIIGSALASGKLLVVYEE